MAPSARKPPIEVLGRSLPVTRLACHRARTFHTRIRGRSTATQGYW